MDPKTQYGLARKNVRTALIMGAVALALFVFTLWHGL
jgi:hypothetical protein